MPTSGPPQAVSVPYDDMKSYNLLPAVVPVMVEQITRKHRFQNLRSFRELARKAQRAGEWGKAQELWLRYNQQKYHSDETRIERRRTAKMTDVSSEPAIDSTDCDSTPTQMDTILRFITDQTMGIVTEQQQRDILHRVRTICAVSNDWHDSSDNVRQGLREGTLIDFD